MVEGTCDSAFLGIEFETCPEAVFLDLFEFEFCPGVGLDLPLLNPRLFGD